MAGLARTVGLTLVGTLAVPAAAFSGLVSLFILGAMIFDKSARTFSGVMYLATALAICYFSVRQLMNMSKRARAQVDAINAKEGLQLSVEHMLGYPSPTFIVFDTQNKKLAVCSSVTGDYKTADFSYILGWKYEYSSSEKLQGTGYATGSTVRIVQGHIQETRSQFVLILEVADEHHPTLAFPMANENRAKSWCARLNTMINGVQSNISYGKV